MSNNLAQAYLVGNAVDNPQIRFRGLDGGPTLTTFRVAMNHRFQGADGQWQDGDPCYMEVQCWGTLGDNVIATVGKGMSVIVVGRIVQSTWEASGEDGKTVTRSVLRVRATHVGPDLGARNVLVNVRKAVEQNAAKNAEQEVTKEAAKELVGVGAATTGMEEREGEEKTPF
ncbi:single-stranded DNA-binding protein [uncultured Corynebacterium sp.]|uniref:single-stranded DNA-binding protein n=1 Tax=uncultured Corynebacterium sp. TaxID=159447 RepID=UPI0025F473FE|nr:single-stranded DNA-binding protein [uncultured Corynebacterium sp.]